MFALIYSKNALNRYQQEAFQGEILSTTSMSGDAEEVQFLYWNNYLDNTISIATWAASISDIVATPWAIITFFYIIIFDALNGISNSFIA